MREVPLYALSELRPPVQNRNEMAQRAERGGAPFPRARHSLVLEHFNISSQPSESAALRENSNTLRRGCATPPPNATSQSAARSS